MAVDYALTDDALRELAHGNHRAAKVLPIGYAVVTTRYVEPVAAPVLRMTTMSEQHDYIPDNDVYRTLDDGRTELIAAKGVPMPQARAEALGLTKGRQTVQPAETKGAPYQTVDGTPIYTREAVQADPNAGFRDAEIQQQDYALEEAPERQAGVEAPAEQGEEPRRTTRSKK